jgi:hypothetical protein
MLWMKFLFYYLILSTHLLANSFPKIDGYIKERGYRVNEASLKKNSPYFEAWNIKDYGATITLKIFKDQSQKKINQLRQECELCKFSKVQKEHFSNECKNEIESLKLFLSKEPMKQEWGKELYFFDQMDHRLKTENKIFRSELDSILRSIRITRAPAYCDARGGYYMAIDFFIQKNAKIDL